MFNVNNAPATARELEGFAASVARQIDQVQFDPADVSYVFATKDGDSILLLAADPADEPAALAQIDQLLATRRRLVATASLAAWSPTPHGPSSPAWLLVAVGAGGLPAFAAVRRISEDRRWTALGTQDLPWFALSTASALRGAVESGAALRLKQASSEELYRRPDEEPHPPLDDRGQL